MRTRTGPKRAFVALSGLLAFVAVAALPGLGRSEAAFSSLTGSEGQFASLGAPPIADQADWWLDAALQSTKFANVGCSTPAGTTTGSTVACWVNRNNSSQAVTSAASAQSADLAPDKMGNLRPIRFDGTDRLGGPDLFGGSLSDAQIFIVVRENIRTNGMTLSLNGTNTGADRFSLSAPWSNNVWYFDAGPCCASTANRVAPWVTQTFLGQTVLFNGWKDSAAGNNGFQILDKPRFYSTGHTAATTSGGLSLGLNHSVTVLPYSHDVAELLVFDQHLSEADETAITTYLTIKWDI